MQHPEPPLPRTPDGIIISPDTQRAQRIPPHQVQTRKWPVLHAGPEPTFDPATWDFTVFPRPYVEPPKRWNYAEFMALPKVKVFADMHCVTRWSRLDNLWEGIATRELLNHVRISPEAKFVMIHCEYGFTTNLPIEDFFAEDALFAYRNNGQDLDIDHGWPLRLVVPRLYAWKSAKWVRAVEFMEKDRPGFWESWENGGYHMRGDPWVQNATHPHGERFRER